ncbi:MAG TPA: metalloregulator ArsR/SmtB family transcription factor [Anaerolineales bacterium]|jgi:DNA-binding transcriptional ArsR family regulator|nr:metalloregulator ArsR/SmtB family transcription factor [Anaerolineales bacterium]
MPTALDRVAHAISDPTRRRILDELHAAGPQRAGDLAARFARISRPAVSKHLRVLRGSRLIAQERRGRELWYRLDPAPLSQVEKWLDKYSGFWQTKLQGLKKASEK